MAKANSQNITIPREGKTVYTGSDWKPVTYTTEEGVEKRHNPNRVRDHRAYD